MEIRGVSFTPTLQKSEGEVVVLYFEPSTTQNLKSSGFPDGPLTRGPKGPTKWQNQPHPSNSTMGISDSYRFATISVIITNHYLRLDILFMQLWGLHSDISSLS